MPVDNIDMPRENRDKRGGNACRPYKDECQQGDDAGDQSSENRKGDNRSYADEEKLKYTAEYFAQRVAERVGGRW